MQQVDNSAILAGVMPARTVKPRTRGYVHMNLAVAALDGILDEHGEVHDDVCAYVKDSPPTAFITIDPSSFLGALDDRYNEHPHWRFTLARINVEKGEASISRVKLMTFGFRACKTPQERARCPICEHGSVRKTRLHQCWDPRAMSPTPVLKLIGDSSPSVLLQWGVDVRAWAREQNLELRTALSGYGAQLLRDPRFYPDARRRVPRASNERIRPALLGNLVRLVDVKPGPTTYNVTSIDQRSAHHRIVQDIALPDANTLFARGYFNNPEAAPRLWAPRGTLLYERTIKQPGLVYVSATSRLTGPNEFRFLQQNFTGQQRLYAWTNTIDFLESTGTRIDGIIAAWTSTRTDDGLSQYGNWAQNQIETASPVRKRWLKPLLHSTYGLLAARPRPLEIGRNVLDNTGRSSHFLLGPRAFEVTARTLTAWQPAFVNVAQRGMIEAETQLRSLVMAQYLTDVGCRVTHIHTDGLHVEGKLPLLPDTWGVNGLTDVMYLDNVSWLARERDCLPGRDSRERVEVMKHHAGLLSRAQDHRTIDQRRRLAGHIRPAQDDADVPQG
jgi:hypothetical protein